jgi:hypothetical protein
MTKTNDTSSISISGGKKGKTIKNMMAQYNMDQDMKSISGGSHICKCAICGKSMKCKSMKHKSMNRKRSNKRTRSMMGGTGNMSCRALGSDAVQFRAGNAA